MDSQINKYFVQKWSRIREQTKKSLFRRDRHRGIVDRSIDSLIVLLGGLDQALHGENFKAHQLIVLVEVEDEQLVAGLYTPLDVVIVELQIGDIVLFVISESRLHGNFIVPFQLKAVITSGAPSPKFTPILYRSPSMIFDRFRARAGPRSAGRRQDLQIPRSQSRPVFSADSSARAHDPTRPAILFSSRPPSLPWAMLPPMGQKTSRIRGARCVIFVIAGSAVFSLAAGTCRFYSTTIILPG
jgi:hypothetical protein